MDVIIGWPEITKLTPYDRIPDSIMADMLKQGIVKRVLRGRIPQRRWRVWCYPEEVKYYFNERAKEDKNRIWKSKPTVKTE